MPQLATFGDKVNQKMTHFFDTHNIVLEAWGYQMSWIELVATLFGLLAVWLSAKEHIANWGFGLINVALSFMVFYQSALYSDMILQIYFFATGVYGWWMWTRVTDTQESLVKITFLTRPQQIALGASVVVGTLLLAQVIMRLPVWLPQHFPEPASFPYVDTLIMVMSIFGNYFLTIKKIEAWILWVLVDITAPVVYFKKGMLLFTFEFLVFLAIATFALINWYKIYKKQV
jgi:nicotinamide mononucleotide transporter